MRTFGVILLLSAYVHAEECGRSRPKTPPTRIVGGRFAAPREFPWQLSLQIRIGTNRYVHICGASVISPTRALTAAHCYHPRVEYRVVAGLFDQRITEDDDVQISKVSQFAVHESYNRPDPLMNDIAVLSLATPLNMTEAVEKVCLPSREMRVTPDFMITVSGWGNTRENGSASDVLQAVDLPVVTDAACNYMYDNPTFDLTDPVSLNSLLDFYWRERIKENMMCAGFKEGQKDSCQGDSGGPAVVRGEAGNYVQIGVTSWGVGCARRRTPGVYTEVPYFIDWINKNME